MAQIAVNCHIVGYNEIADAQEKEALEKRLVDLLKSFNFNFSKYISKPLIFSDGKIEGYFDNGEMVYELLLRVEFNIHPLRMRVGIGAAGSRSAFTSMPEDIAAKRAADMLFLVEDSEHRNKHAVYDMMLKSDWEKFDKIINALLLMAAGIKRGWSNRQREIIRMYIRNGENQVRTAEQIGISQSSVQRSLRSAQYYAFKSAVLGLGEAFGYITSE